MEKWTNIKEMKKRRRNQLSREPFWPPGSKRQCGCVSSVLTRTLFCVFLLLLSGCRPAQSQQLPLSAYLTITTLSGPCEPADLGWNRGLLIAVSAFSQRTMQEAIGRFLEGMQLSLGSKMQGGYSRGSKWGPRPASQWTQPRAERSCSQP